MKKWFFVLIIFIVFLGCSGPAQNLETSPETVADVINLPGSVASNYQDNPDFKILYLGTDNDGIDYFSVSPVPGELVPLLSKKQHCACVKERFGCDWKGGILDVPICGWSCVKTVCTPCINCYP